MRKLTFFAFLVLLFTACSLCAAQTKVNFDQNTTASKVAVKLFGGFNKTTEHTFTHIATGKVFASKDINDVIWRHMPQGEYVIDADTTTPQTVTPTKPVAQEVYNNTQAQAQYELVKQLKANVDGLNTKLGDLNDEITKLKTYLLLAIITGVFAVIVVIAGAVVVIKKPRKEKKAEQNSGEQTEKPPQEVAENTEEVQQLPPPVRPMLLPKWEPPQPKNIVPIKPGSNLPPTTDWRKEFNEKIKAAMRAELLECFSCRSWAKELEDGEEPTEGLEVRYLSTNKEKNKVEETIFKTLRHLPELRGLIYKRTGNGMERSLFFYFPKPEAPEAMEEATAASAVS